MFIAVEGIDGAGTSTQSDLLASWLKEKKVSVHQTREPSDGRVGRIIRDYLSGADGIPDMDRHYHTLALLFAADRLDHLGREVEPRLAEGVSVVSDRYVLSSLVYQSLHCERKWVLQINSEALSPQVTFLIDVPAELAMERIARRSLFAKTDIYETRDNLEKLRRKYLKAAGELYPDQEILVIDGTDAPEKVLERITHQLGPRLREFAETGHSSEQP